VVRTATVVANVGTWMYDAASGWLMTSLNPDPLTVSLVQVAGSLPMFLFALPPGLWRIPSTKALGGVHNHHSLCAYHQ
jgi:hypothetical protein